MLKRRLEAIKLGAASLRDSMKTRQKEIDLASGTMFWRESIHEVKRGHNGKQKGRTQDSGPQWVERDDSGKLGLKTEEQERGEREISSVLTESGLEERGAQPETTPEPDSPNEKMARYAHTFTLPIRLAGSTAGASVPSKT
ncbi:hypothetical protein BU16DRAFT_527870 [Lophium mytilinum]|uniref:Uncharacterized protein n=1 Tax=Lophium mytilinum TaxID=390894 RepID=A0A6A6QS06_9PEZI|nr:hypothetical protein BU16DRAFT_527870 [Lophium mytilinum]